MKAAVMYRPGDIRVENIENPTVKQGHALVRVAACGVCGSDIPRMLSKGAHNMPLVCGHEFSGYIADIGSGVAGYNIGDLVTVPPMIPCLKCEQCVTGNPSRCLDYDYFGSRRDGAYTEYVNVPLTNLVKVPQGLDPTAAAMVDPAAIALHAVWKGDFHIGQTGAVTGCGPIGLFAIQWLRLMGAKEIVAVDIAPEKLDMARTAGATQTILAEKIEDESLPQCDLIVEGSGHSSSINAAIRMAGAAGHIVFIGIPVSEIGLSTATFSHLLRQEVSLHGAWNSFGMPFPGQAWQSSIDKLTSGDLLWEFMVTHDLGLDALPDMMQCLGKRSEITSKVIFRPE